MRVERYALQFMNEIGGYYKSTGFGGQVYYGSVDEAKQFSSKADAEKCRVVFMDGTVAPVEVVEIPAWAWNI